MPRVPKEQSYLNHLTALQLRLAGRSYEDIRVACGYKSVGSAYAAVESAMKKTLREPASRIRELEQERIDKALASIWKNVLAGHLGAVQTFIRLSERRARLLGLDEPVKQDITSGGEVIKGYTILANPDMWDENVK